MTKQDLSEESRALIARYTAGAPVDLARQRRLALQYGAGALLIALAAIVLDQPWLSILVWLVFALWLRLRWHASQKQAAAVAQAFKELGA